MYNLFHFQIDVLADLNSVANEESPSPSLSPVLHSKFYLSTADVKQRLTELQKRTMAKKLLDWVSVSVCSINAVKYIYPTSNSFGEYVYNQRNNDNQTLAVGQHNLDSKKAFW